LKRRHSCRSISSSAWGAEELQQVRGQPPLVVRSRIRIDRLVADHAVDLRLQPPGRVLVKARHRCCARRAAVARAGGSLPHAGADARELVVELDARGPLAPAAAAAACAVTTLVQGAALAAPVGVKAQPEDARPVGERVDVQPAGGRAAHQRRPRGMEDLRIA